MIRRSSVLIPLISGLVTDKRRNVAKAAAFVLIPLISGLVTDLGVEPGEATPDSLNPFDFRAGY